MDIIDKLIQSIPIVDDDSKVILSKLLVKKLQEAGEVEVKEVELTQEEKDDRDILNYTGEGYGKEK